MHRRLGVYYRINRASVVDMQAAILEIGAIYVSADVHDGWDIEARNKKIDGHASLPAVKGIRKADSLGGHAFALVGYNRIGFDVLNVRMERREDRWVALTERFLDHMGRPIDLCLAGGRLYVVEYGRQKETVGPGAGGYGSGGRVLEVSAKP